jgi:hypothetical protein
MADINDIAGAIDAIAQEASLKLVDRFETAAKNAADLSNHLASVLRNSTDLQKKFKSVDELQKSMTKNSKLRDKLLKESRVLHQKDLASYWKAVDKYIDKQVSKIKGVTKQEKERVRLQSQFAKMAKDSTAEFERQGKALDPKSGRGIKELIGGALVSAFEKLTKQMKIFAAAIKDAINADTFQGGVEAIAKPIDDLIDSIPLVGGLLKFAFQTIRKAFFSTWDYIEQRVLPTNKRLIEQFGVLGKSTAELKKQAIGMGNTFIRMGLGFQEGMSAVVDFQAALKTSDMNAFGASAKEMATLGVKLIKVLGMDAESAGKLVVAFDRAGVSATEFNKTMVDAQVVAEQYGVIPNQLRKDFSEASNVMLGRFSVANRMAFSESAAMARLYGTSIKEVDASFGKTMDTFEGTADIAAKLNAIFGTNINSMELMMETDPTKRMQMLSKALLEQGKNWENLSVFEKNVIKQTIGIDDAMGNLMLSEKNLGLSEAALMEKMKAHEKQRERQLRADEQWNRSIRNLKQTLLNYKEAVDKIIRAIAQSIAKFFGFESAMGTTQKTAEKVQEVFDEIVGAINKWNKDGGPEKLRKSIEKIGTAFTVMAKGAKVALSPFIAISKIGDLFSDSEEKATKRAMALEKARGSASAPMRISGAKDALITKRGEVIKFHPNDNILATQSPVTQTGNGAVAAAGGASAGGYNGPSVIHVTLNMDGKKIAEEQVRLSRVGA